MIAAIAWGSAAGVALVILTFCAYEIRWKLARLRTDAADLQQTLERLRTVAATDRTR